MSLYKFKFYNATLSEHDEQYVTYKPKLVNVKCPHCASHPLILRKAYKVLGGYEEYYLCPACEQAIDKETTLYASHDDLTVVKMKEATTEPIPVPNIPQPCNIRYTPEFLEKAAKAMREIPLKRKDIRVHDIEMQSQCPACGGMLYEEANIIFNYCPWCAQALDKDFSEEE